MTRARRKLLSASGRNDRHPTLTLDSSTKHLEGCTSILHSPQQQHLYYSILALELVTDPTYYLSVVTQVSYFHNASRLNGRRQVTTTKPA